MAIVQMNSEELVQALRRSQLPTILVEGRDDMTVYRWLEECNFLKRVDVMQCGGKDNLLSVFGRRAEFGHIPCVFLADRDMWMFTETPLQFRDMVITKGYSIENDLLDGSCVYHLLSRAEINEFNSLCDVLASWFAFEVEQFRRNQDYCVDLHPNRLIPLGSTTLDVNVLSPRIFRPPHKRLVRSIRKLFHLKFRGKGLVQIYTRILNSPHRSSKYSRNNILEICAKCNSTLHTQRLIRLIHRRINA